jgi:hypothetical protein
MNKHCTICLQPLLAEENTVFHLDDQFGTVELHKVCVENAKADRELLEKLRQEKAGAGCG